MRFFGGNLIYLLLLAEGWLIFRQVATKSYSMRVILAPFIILAFSAYLLFKSRGHQIEFNYPLLVSMLVSVALGIISGLKTKIIKAKDNMTVKGGLLSVIFSLIVLLLVLIANGVTVGIILSNIIVTMLVLVLSLYLALNGVIILVRLYSKRETV